MHIHILSIQDIPSEFRLCRILQVIAAAEIVASIRWPYSAAPLNAAYPALS